MRRRLPSLNALRAFEAAARLGSMTAAAQELCVTHGAISRQVRALQDELGVALFEPRVQPLQLTASGQALLPVLTHALDEVAGGVASIRRDSVQTLDVSCLSTFAMRWLIPRLHRFHERRPDVDVRLSMASHAVQIERRRHDVVIGVEAFALSAPGQTERDVLGVPLFRECLGLVLSPHLAASWVERPFAQQSKALKACPRLQTRTRLSAWQDWARASGAVLGAAPEREFPHYSYTLEAALGGLGLCVSPWHLVTDDVQSGRLMAPLGFVPSHLCYVATRARQATAAAVDLCGWLQAEAAAAPAAPAPA